MYRKGTYLRRKEGTREDIPIIIKIMGYSEKSVKERILDALYVRDSHYTIKDIYGCTNYYWGEFLKEHYEKISKEEAFVDVL